MRELCYLANGSSPPTFVTFVVRLVIDGYPLLVTALEFPMYILSSTLSFICISLMNLSNEFMAVGTYGHWG